MPTNVFQNPTFIANEFLRRLKNKLVFLKNTSGSEYASRFTSSPKPGETISIRLPMQVTTRSGETFSAGDYKQRVTSMTVQTTEGVDLEFTNRELMFNFDKFADTVVEDCAVKLGNRLESLALAAFYKHVASYVGTPGTTPTSLKTYNQARATLVRNGAPDSGNIMLVTPDMVVEAVDAGKGLFNPQAIAGQYSSGLMSPIAGAKAVYESNLLPVHTVGWANGGVSEVKGAAQVGTSLITDGWTTKPNAGDIFTLESVYAVNHETKVSYGTAKKFSILSSTALAGTESTLTLASQGIVATGAYQNVDAGPADNADLTMWAPSGTVTPQGLYYNPEAFLFCTFDQPEPPGKVCKFVRDPDTGIAIRWIDDWDTTNNKELRRFDVVFAWGPGRPEFACRIAG